MPLPNNSEPFPTFISNLAVASGANGTMYLLQGGVSKQIPTSEFVTLDGSGNASIPGNISATGSVRAGYATDLMIEGIPTSFQSALAEPPSSWSAVWAQFESAPPGPAVTFAKSRGGSLGALAPVQAGDQLAYLGADAWDGTQWSTGAFVQVTVDGSVSGTIVPGRIVFFTGDTVGGAPERMRIDSGGNVTIGGFANVPGTFNQNAYLQVLLNDGRFSFSSIQYGNTTNDSTMLFAKTRGVTPSTQGAVVNGTDWLGEIDFIGSDGTAWQYGAAINIEVDQTVTSGHVPCSLVLRSFNKPSGQYVGETLRCDSKGNVTINVAAIATNATDGFLYIPTCAGAPTGVPTSKTGRAPMVYDTTNHKFWIYDTAWKGVVLS